MSALDATDFDTMTATGPGPFQIRCAGQTDIGGGRENQDMWFSWVDPAETGTHVIGVLDGHGREVGRLAAVSARDAIMDWLEQPSNLEMLRGDPVAAMGRLFAHAHLAIKSAFRQNLEANNWMVDEAPEGYLLKRRSSSQTWQCLHGGTSCSVIALIDGRRLVTGNVGDSSALMGLSDEESAAAASESSSTSSRRLRPIPSQCLKRLADLGTGHLHGVDIRTTAGSLETQGGKGYKGEATFVADSLGGVVGGGGTGNNGALASMRGGVAGDAMDTSGETITELVIRTSQEAQAPPVRDTNLPAPGELLPTESELAAAATGANETVGVGTAAATSTGSEVERMLASYLVTADHSPEAPTEFERIRRMRCQNGNPAEPMLLMVYDSPSGGGNKAACPPVFQLDKGNPAALPSVTNRGKYYKNVRGEWASLVATPPSARFQDALAFTRSLGDLHLQSYGVTFLPEIFELNLEAVLPAVESSSTSESGSVATILACTDGIWDNWKYDDCVKYCLVSEHIESAKKDAPQRPGTRLVGDQMVEGGKVPGTQQAANRLLQKNAEYAQANFGSTADNATAVVAFIWRS